MAADAPLPYDRDRLTVAREDWLGGPALSYAGRPRDVLDVLDLAARARPDQVAVVDAVDGATTTTLELADRVAALATAWRSKGLRPGRGVGVAAGNSAGHLAAILACAATGLVAVGLSSRLATEQWRYQLQHAGCALLLHDDDHAAAAARAAAGLPMRLASLAEETGVEGPGWRAFAAGRPPAGARTTYQVVYTSGTTGRPKASRVVHRASLHSGLAYDRLLRLQTGESTGVLFSLGYISAMHAHVIPALLSGARLVMLPTGSSRTWVEQLARYDVAWAYAVPSWWRLALREPGLTAAGLPRLRLAGAGGSPFPDDLRDGLAERLPRTELMNIYGLSETHSPATVLRGQELWTHAGSAGRPLEVVQVQVRDEAGTVLPEGEAGEVWLGGSLVTAGYAGDEDATAAAVVHGWLRTGDIGVLEAPGEVVAPGDGRADAPVLRLLDRVKDMVNRAGVKVFSAEVERVLGGHPAVAECACVAVPDPRSGETVAVVLVGARQAAERPGDAELRAFVREHLGTSAVPSVLEWVDALPRGGTGKTDKRALRDRLASARTAAGAGTGTLGA